MEDWRLPPNGGAAYCRGFALQVTISRDAEAASSFAFGRRISLVVLQGSLRRRGVETVEAIVGLAYKEILHTTPCKVAL